MKFSLLITLLVAVICICPSFGQINRPTLLGNPAFEQAVIKNLRFPAAAQRLGKSIRVYVSFTLSDKGSYQEVAVVNLGPIDKSLKQEIDRLWHILPNQYPKYAGDYVIPIAFMLGEGGPERLKPISNQDDKLTKQGTYTLLKELSVTGWIECERRTLSN